MRTASSQRLAYITTAWGVVFAVVHAYWAAGGGVGMSQPAETAAAQAYIGFIAVLGLCSAMVALAFVPGRGGDRAGLTWRRRLARGGGAALLVGVAVGVLRWIFDGGLAQDGAGGVIITMYFLAGGLLFTKLGSDGAVARGGVA